MEQKNKDPKGIDKPKDPKKPSGSGRGRGRGCGGGRGGRLTSPPPGGRARRVDGDKGAENKEDTEEDDEDDEERYSASVSRAQFTLGTVARIEVVLGDSNP